MSNLSASLNMNSSLGPGKVRAMFQARRQGGTSAQGSPVGWDKSYPLEPINKGTPPRKNGNSANKRTPPGKSTPPKKSGARRPPPQPMVSGRRQKQPPRGPGGAGQLRRAKSHSSLSPPHKTGAAPQRSGKPVRSRSVNERRRKPSHRDEERNRINDEMRRREGEMLSKARGNTQKPAALKEREPRRSKQPKAKPPAPKPSKQKNLTAGNGGQPPAPSPRSRRNSYAPYKENKPPPTPEPRPPPTDPNMAQCSICTRNFAKDRLEKHESICAKTTQKKRNTFDPMKMRLQGTESEQYIKNIKNSKPELESPKKKDWRKQHEEFVNNIREAKRAQAHIDAGGDVRDLPTPKPAANDDYVQCPHCERRFNEAAAERHIPKCSSISSNKGPPKAGGGGKGRGKRR